MKTRIRVINRFGKDSDKEGQTETELIEADVTKGSPLAIHKNSDLEKKSYVITHLRSGVVVGEGRTKADCKRLVKLFKGIDWSGKFLSDEDVLLYINALVTYHTLQDIPVKNYSEEEINNYVDNFYTEEQRRDIVERNTENYKQFLTDCKQAIDNFKE